MLDDFIGRSSCSNEEITDPIFGESFGDCFQIRLNITGPSTLDFGIYIFNFNIQPLLK